MRRWEVCSHNFQTTRIERILFKASRHSVESDHRILLFEIRVTRLSSGFVNHIQTFLRCCKFERDSNRRDTRGNQKDDQISSIRTLCELGVYVNKFSKWYPSAAIDLSETINRELSPWRSPYKDYRKMTVPCNLIKIHDDNVTFQVLHASNASLSIGWLYAVVGRGCIQFCFYTQWFLDKWNTVKSTTAGRIGLILFNLISGWLIKRNCIWNIYIIAFYCNYEVWCIYSIREMWIVDLVNFIVFSKI